MEEIAGMTSAPFSYDPVRIRGRSSAAMKCSVGIQSQRTVHKKDKGGRQQTEKGRTRGRRETAVTKLHKRAEAGPFQSHRERQSCTINHRQRRTISIWGSNKCPPPLDWVGSDHRHRRVSLPLLAQNVQLTRWERSL